MCEGILRTDWMKPVLKTDSYTAIMVLRSEQELSACWQRFQLTIKSAHMIDSVGKEFLTHLCVSQLMNTHAVLSSEVKSPRKYFFHFVFVIVINQSYPSD